MQKTPNALRKHVGLVGDTNAGKSSLFNALLGQNAAIVSEERGTTTDPVLRAMELIPFGPIVLVDTPGLGDDTSLGSLRMNAAFASMRRCDLLIYAADAMDFDWARYKQISTELPAPHLLVFTKADMADTQQINALLEKYPGTLAVDVMDSSSVDTLKSRLVTKLEELEDEDETLIGDLVPAGGSVILVTPIDSEAPKGRLILPQVQLIRDCLDHGILCHVCREHELVSMLSCLKAVDLVVTDSQAFAFVESVIPKNLPLTSFSLLLARQKGDITQLLEGARHLGSLTSSSRVLMLEGCTHNHTHEDIGRIKIPALIQKRTGAKPVFTFCSGYDFPADYAGYDLAIQCGGCMLNKREITSRLRILKDAGVPVTNYGVALAQLGGILERCAQVFDANLNSPEIA